jgi:isopenicillin-N epimerase
LNARDRLAEFLGTSPANLAFVENAAAGMNVVANTFRLGREDEVLLTDHEYGAVLRVWQRAASAIGSPEPRIAQLPAKIESAEQVVDAVLNAATEHTRLIVVSHITSPTATVLPVKQICERARQRGIAVCIDGPHAPAQVPLVIDELGCDFYTASLHKWVSAPFGSGFLFVAPKWQQHAEPPLLSWGRQPPLEPTQWWEEFVWVGTRDPSAYLATPAAIELLEEVGLDAFRTRTHQLAQYARHRLIELTKLEPQRPDSSEWYGSMVRIPLPPGDAAQLQERLWQEHHIEVPIVVHNGQRSIRVSCHLYNSHRDIDSLISVLSAELRRE